MIVSISSQKINFTGASFGKTHFLPDVFIGLKNTSRKLSDALHAIAPENHRAYANINNNGLLEKKAFGYALKDFSEELPIYTGTMIKTAGLSTETGYGFGGGWIKADINTPLSTQDVFTCAVLNLVNESDGEHLLYHVYSETPAKDILVFIQENFPKFNKVNIIPGSKPQTSNAVNNILCAIDEINPNAEKHFYHFGTKNPEIVAHQGKLSYIKDKISKRATFQEIYQYYYSIDNNFSF